LHWVGTFLMIIGRRYLLYYGREDCPVLDNKQSIHQKESE
jgi:hypothetical protein